MMTAQYSLRQEGSLNETVVPIDGGKYVINLAKLPARLRTDVRLVFG